MVSVFFCTDIMLDAKVCYSREFNTWYFITSQVVLVVKSTRANAGDVRDMGLTPGLGRSPREGHSNPLQNSCLEDPMDRGAWWAVVHRVTRNRTQLKQLSPHLCGMTFYSLKHRKCSLRLSWEDHQIPAELQTFSLLSIPFPLPAAPQAHLRNTW